jgi:hypothetical protein
MIESRGTECLNMIPQFPRIEVVPFLNEISHLTPRRAW